MSDDTVVAEMGKREGALQGLDVLSRPAEDEIHDVDPSAWVGQEDGEQLGTVEINGARLKIAALTEEETNVLMKRCRRPDPRNPQAEPRLDAALFRVSVIAHSLNKANPGKPQIMPSQLNGKKTGTLTTIQSAIMELSGMETADRRPTAGFFA